VTTYEIARQILREIDRVLSQVSETEIDDLCDAVTGARHIIVYGLGREGLVMRGFAMRLMHLGLDVAVVGDMSTPPIGPGDLFMVSCGPGYRSTVQALTGLVYLPAQTMAEDEQSSSTQAMGSAFEQALWILFDALVPRLQTSLGQSAEEMRRRHTNME
jgi:6-phospho-3-hexuloisomerase